MTRMTKGGVRRQISDEETGAASGSSAHTVGELADLAVSTLMDSSSARRLSAQRGISLIWRRMPFEWRTHTQGVTVRPRRAGSELVVYLDSSAWVYELSMRADDVVSSWNRLVGDRDDPLHVTSARFMLSRRAYEGGARNVLSITPTREAPSSLPLDEGERRRVEVTSARVSDEGVRRHLEAAMTAVMEWKKAGRREGKD